jgi:hypothetical protein
MTYWRKGKKWAAVSRLFVVALLLASMERMAAREDRS